MNDHPNALELIRIAHQTLTSDILPDAKAEQLYALRMIANALGIAARELEAHDMSAASETRGLDTLYPGTPMPRDLHVRNHQFAKDIRSGAFESGDVQATALRHHLLHTARAKLAAAYPKALATSNKIV